MLQAGGRGKHNNCNDLLTLNLYTLKHAICRQVLGSGNNDGYVLHFADHSNDAGRQNILIVSKMNGTSQPTVANGRRRDASEMDGRDA
jgi:hypothetical protein